MTKLTIADIADEMLKIFDLDDAPGPGSDNNAISPERLS